VSESRKTKCIASRQVEDEALRLLAVSCISKRLVEASSTRNVLYTLHEAC
jgi:hypothetical protein